MIKPFSVLAMLCVAALGYAAGFATPMLKDRGEKNTAVDTVAQRHPDLNVETCRDLPLSEVAACLDAMLAAAAATTLDANLCTEIQQNTLRESCVNRVSFSSRVSDSIGFCSGLTDDPLCKDLATILAAKLGNKRESCSVIGSADLRAVCSNLFGPVELPPASSAEKPVEGVLPLKEYGLVCLPFDQRCLDAHPAFNAAVSSQSDALCRDLGIYSELCLNEVSLYRSYQSRTVSQCSARMPLELCQLYLAVAWGMDGDTKQCDTLANVQLRESCTIEVSAAQGQKRFGYLTK